MKVIVLKKVCKRPRTVWIEPGVKTFDRVSFSASAYLGYSQQFIDVNIKCLIDKNNNFRSKSIDYLLSYFQ